ncbi:hypothetical protein BpPP18_25730 [Weizmannia acidilactici]|nr:hypothetical protein BpPP18_25730 [Weizmannia acidilactici]
MIACNRAGNDPANTFAGHSMIIGPWGGDILSEGREREQLVTAEIDLAAVDEARSIIPVFSDRMPDFY